VQDLLARNPSGRLEVGPDGVRERADRRAYAVTLTPAGRERLAVAECSVPALPDEALAPLNEQERGQLSALLLKLDAPG